MTTIQASFILSMISALITAPVSADEIQGKVVSVSDGDTLTVLTPTKNEVRIRLVAIDAPEKAQAFGQRSKQALSDLCFGKPAKINVVDIDRYGRSVGEVVCDGVYANQAMINLGLAWVYRKYAEGYGDFYKVEESAKLAKRGLWSDSQPIPPWEWRKTHQ